MEEVKNKEEAATDISKGTKGKRKFWGAFINFLACGGFLLILVAIVGIVILISVLTK